MQYFFDFLIELKKKENNCKKYFTSKYLIKNVIIRYFWKLKNIYTS